jgi:hypothetical protein
MTDTTNDTPPAEVPTEQKPSPAPSAEQFRAKAHSWLNRASSDVEFCLGSGAAIIERSTFGAMLERSQLYAFAGTGNSDDKPVPIPKRKDGQAKIKHTHEEPGYDIDFATLARIGRGNKLLDLVGSQSKLLRAVLVAYHGECGARWGRAEEKNNSGGVGNRDLSVYPLTAMGAKWIGALRSKFPLSGALRADEVLANEYVMGKRSSRDDLRMHRLSRCAIEARALIAEAHEVLEAAAQYQHNNARKIRAANVKADRVRARPLVDAKPQHGSRVLMRSSTGTVMHGPFPGIDMAAWNDVGQRGCLVEVVA